MCAPLSPFFLSVFSQLPFISYEISASNWGGVAVASSPLQCSLPLFLRLLLSSSILLFSLTYVKDAAIYLRQITGDWWWDPWRRTCSRHISWHVSSMGNHVVRRKWRRSKIEYTENFEDMNVWFLVPYTEKLYISNNYDLKT